MFLYFPINLLLTGVCFFIVLSKNILKVIMKTKTYIFRLTIALLTFLFSIGVYAVWNNSQANKNTLQTNIALPISEALPVVNEIDNSNADKTTSCSKVEAKGNIDVKVKRFISSKGNKCYRYAVTNNTNQEIRGIDVGTEKSTDLAELIEIPLGWSESSIKHGFDEARNSKSLIEAIAVEEQNNIFITTKSFQVDARKTNSFYVCMQNKWDSNYQTSHWIAYMYDGSDIAGKLINLDAK